jgi:hypothetical protein
MSRGFLFAWWAGAAGLLVSPNGESFTKIGQRVLKKDPTKARKGAEKTGRFVGKTPSKAQSQRRRITTPLYQWQ